MQLVRDCVPIERQGEPLWAGWTGLAPLTMFLFKLVPLALLLTPLALTWSVNGVCYQHTKTCLLVQGADLHPFHCRGARAHPSYCTHLRWQEGSLLCHGHPTIAAAADVLPTTTEHGGAGSTCSLTSCAPGSSLSLCRRASSRRPGCPRSPSSHLRFCKTFLQH